MFAFIFLLFASLHPFPTRAALVLRQQLTIPPTNGPCRQNIGLVPLQCSDTTCLDIPTSGVCNIRSQSGFPLCGCCDSSITIACSACGGDAGGGICQGTGSTSIAYQGCPCSTDGGDVPAGNEYKVCPEDQGSDTQMCSADGCDGDTRHQGICDAKTDIGGGLYRFCACCPDGESLACNSCGGESDSGTCRGIAQYTGYQYLNCACSPGGDTPNLPIIPFPIPPPGFPVPPPGTPNPRTPCSDTVTESCANCGGNDGWCQEGDSAGCPCQEDEDECPTGLDVPTCSDSSCGGSTNSSIISTCQGGNEGQNKDCPCFQYIQDSPPYIPFSAQDLLAQAAFLAQLSAAPSSSAASSSTSPSSTPTATGALTCSTNSVASVPAEMIETTGNVTPNQLLYTLRQILCTNACGEPAGIPAGVAWSTGTKTTGDCEISVSIAGEIEAYMYRETPSEGDQWQQCWDSTQHIIDTCVAEGPNTGWVNGPNAYQFYQGGYRPLNGNGALHAPMSGDALQPSVVSGAVYPQNLDSYTCGSGVGGARLSDCLNILGSIVNGQILSATNTTDAFCTSDPTCLESGNTGTSDAKIIYGSYCEVAASGTCAFVAATKSTTFGGFPGKSCFSPADVSNFIRLAANTCGANQASGVWAAGFKSGDVVAGIPFTAFGLVDATNPGVLYVP